MPIILSQEPPVWEAWGGLNFQIVPDLWRKSWTGPCSTHTLSILRASRAPTKLVPRSEQNSFTDPRTHTKRRKAFINAELLISSTSSMCTPRMAIQVNKIAHFLLCARPHLVLQATTSHGPNVSTPTMENGGPMEVRS